MVSPGPAVRKTSDIPLRNPATDSEWRPTVQLRRSRPPASIRRPTGSHRFGRFRHTCLLSPKSTLAIAARGAAMLRTPLGLQLRQQLLDAILLFQCRETVFDVVGGNL